MKGGITMKPLIHDEVIRVRVSTEMLEALKEHAYYKEEVTLSSLVRRLIKNHLESENSNPSS